MTTPRYGWGGFIITIRASTEASGRVQTKLVHESREGVGGKKVKEEERERGHVDQERSQGPGMDMDKVAGFYRNQKLGEGTLSPWDGEGRTGASE